MNDFNLKIENINLPEILKHQNKDFFICSIRKKFIQALPEEKLRQQIVTYLTNILGYPSNNIDIEVPMSYFIPRKSGRADIIIYDRKFTLADAKPFILIECKASSCNILLEDFRHHNQLNNYNKVVKAEILMLTNGIEQYIQDSKNEKQLTRLPTFQEFKLNADFQYKEVESIHWIRTNYKQRFNKRKQNSFIKQNFISDNTDDDIIPIIIQLMDLFYDTNSFFKPQKFGPYELVRDCGLRRSNYGYAFSAGLIGDYRFFLFKNEDGNHFKVSYSIYHQNHWGTYLMIAVDDRQGHSIELRFDKYLSILDGDKYNIWHNGSLTAGKKGRLKNSVVIDYIEKKAPFLLNKNNRINLGSLDLSKELNFDQPEVQDFILRTSIYSLLREEVRNNH